MKEGWKRIRKIGKEIVGKQEYKKIMKIGDYSDRTEGLKHRIHSILHLKLLDIEKNLDKQKKEKKYILEPKVIRLKSKIKIFNSSLKKEDYLVLKNLIKDIEEALNV